jgi:hypothetical protein
VFYGKEPVGSDEGGLAFASSPGDQVHRTGMDTTILTASYIAGAHDDNDDLVAHMACP